MTTPAGIPPRVRVTGSRRGLSPIRSRPVSRELDEQTELGDVYLDGLMRAQRRLSALVVSVAAVSLLGLPLLFTVIPATRSLALFGVPFPWLVLGVLVYPEVWLLAWWYTRQAERIEADFTEVVNPS